MAAFHDTGYKLLFSHPEMVRDLLLGFVPGDWVADADFSTLERVNGSYVAESERQRHDDMVWRVKVKGRWLWVYLVLEFQSEPDPWMALRMMVYVGLLAQHLVRENELHDGRLAPILPIVLYNGAPVWRVPADVGDCFTAPPKGLEHFRPALCYHLVDEGRLRLHPLASVRNFAEALFSLERGRAVEDLRRVLQSLDLLLRDPGLQSLRRAFGVWVKSMLRRRAPASTIDDIDRINDIMEADTMLAETIESWFEEARLKGMQKGLQEGLQQGMQEGLQQGLQEGLQQRLQQGRIEGEARVLARLLARRFGDLPPWVQERLASATEAQLDRWTEVVLTAASIDEVFAEPPPGH